ncbi:MAG: acetyl-CoA C-acyltransferase [Thalassospira sp.]|uniref:thiolase family protein n=1 Tax=Thalassospira sp. TaxID=1912094 RepID=UPI0032EC0975
MTKREIVLAYPVRTAIGAFGGALKDTPAVDLGAIVVRETLERSGLEARNIGSVVMGNVIQAGNGMNPARQAAVGGGLPVSAPAFTVNRVCGSGAQAIVTAAQEIELGLHDAAIAGGMENMDRAPHLLAGARRGYRMGDVTSVDSMLCDGLNDAFSGQHSGWHTEDLVAYSGLTREEQDSWAERSQRLFNLARSAGKFRREIVPVTIRGPENYENFMVDEAPRPDTNLESLARLKPAFKDGGTITAGNAPGLNSAASAMVLAERSFAEASGIDPIGRIVACGVGAVEPGLFGLGPVPAVRQALDRAGWVISDLDRVEINEAFAAVPLAVMKELGLPEDIVNVEGGAIAHGHAIGATGAVLVTRLLHSMQRDGVKKGLVTLCIGGGQGIALALEAL